MERVFAQVDISTVFAPAKNFSSLGDLVSVIVPNAFVLAGIITFLLLVLGGFGIIAGAGSGDTKKMEQGKQAITGAVLGLIVVIGSFWVVQIIQSLTGIPLLPMK
jgi:hypothetical protein